MTVTMTQELEQQIRNVFSTTASMDRIYLFHEIPARKLGNAKSRYARILGSDEVVIALYDDTVWGSGKDGFLLTNRRIYGRNIADSAAFVEIQSITDVTQGGSSAAPLLQVYSGMAAPAFEKQMIMTSPNNQAGAIIDAVRQTVLLLNPGLAGPEPTPTAQPSPTAEKARCSGCGATGQVGTKCKWCRSVIV